MTRRVSLSSLGGEVIVTVYHAQDSVACIDVGNDPVLQTDWVVIAVVVIR